MSPFFVLYGERKEKRMVNESVAERSSARRVIAILTAFAVFASFLLFNIFRLGVFSYDYYRQNSFHSPQKHKKAFW